MNPSFNHTLFNADIQLSLIRETIVNLINPQRIYLINSLSLTYAFTDKSIRDEVELQRHYNLMILTAQIENVADIQEKIENSCKQIAPLTVFVLPHAYFDEYYSHNPVFTDSKLVCGKLLYEGPRAPFEPVNDIQVFKDIKKESVESMNRATGFLSSAELLLLTNKTTLAAFMLHQAIEQYCFGRILGTLGINPKTHNLDKLFRLMRFFSFELVRAFPRDTPTEERLFQIVKDAYVSSRYSTAFTVKTTDVKTICDRVRIMIDFWVKRSKFGQ